MDYLQHATFSLGINTVKLAREKETMWKLMKISNKMVISPHSLYFQAVLEWLFSGCVSTFPPSPAPNPCASHDSPFCWMYIVSPLFLGFSHINFSAFLFLPSIFSAFLFHFCYHNLLFPWRLVYSMPKLLTWKSIKQTDVLIPWCQWVQRPSSSWTWACSLVNGPVVSNSGLMMSWYVIATMIMKIIIIHLVGIKDSIEDYLGHKNNFFKC